MRFITFEDFKASLLNLKKLLSLKADKSEVEKKANKSDVKHANLAQNNTREPDYVENRTHWIEEVETVIAEKQNVTTSADGSIFTGIINSLYGLNVGSNYIVEFNGKTYDCAGFVATMQTNAEQEYSLKVTKNSLGTGILEFARDDSKMLHEGDILLISGLCYYVNNEPEMTDTKMYVSINGNPYVRTKDTLYKVKDGTAFMGVTAIGSVNVLSSKEAEFPFLIFDTGYETRLVTKETGTYSVGYTRKTEKVHTIDTKYLPDDTQNSNPDWKQVSPNCASYIENKPFGDTTSGITITALNYGSGQLSEEISESATYSLIFRGELFSDCHFTNRNGDLGLYLEKYKLTLITVNGDKSKIRIRTARFDIEDLCISDIEIYKITGQKKIDAKYLPEGGGGSADNVRVINATEDILGNGEHPLNMTTEEYQNILEWYRNQQSGVAKNILLSIDNRLVFQLVYIDGLGMTFIYSNSGYNRYVKVRQRSNEVIAITSDIAGLTKSLMEVSYLCNTGHKDDIIALWDRTTVGVIRDAGDSVPDNGKSIRYPALVFFGDEISYGTTYATLIDRNGVMWSIYMRLSSGEIEVSGKTDYVTNTSLTDILQNYVPADNYEENLQEIAQLFGTKLDKNQGTANAGKILGIGADGIVVPQDKPTYTLPQATADALGGIKADAATAEDTQDVRIGTDGKLKTKPTGGSTVTVDSELSSTSTNPVQNKVVTSALAGKITAPTTAAVGQIIKVKSVDGTGKPTEWEAADMPSGGGGETWEKLVDTTLAEAVESVSYTFDNCKRIKALIAPVIANGEYVDGWKRFTINNVLYPTINGKLQYYQGICFKIDSEYPPYVQEFIGNNTKTTANGIIGGLQTATLENIAPNGVTEFGCQTAALLKVGTKIEIWGVKS